MRISENGIELIKRFEGCRLVAYKAVKTEEYYTIGYGHYGADVFKGMTISQLQAEEYIKKDLEKFENYVNILRIICVKYFDNFYTGLIFFLMISIVFLKVSFFSTSFPTFSTP